MIPLILVTGPTKAILHKTEIVPCLSQPDVIVWDARFFKFDSVNMQTSKLTYVECFTFVVV